MFNRINGYFEKINGNKYLTLVPTKEIKEKIEKYKEMQNKIRYKTIEIPVMVIVVRAIFYENNKYYPQVFLDECLCKL